MGISMLCSSPIIFVCETQLNKGFNFYFLALSGIEPILNYENFQTTLDYGLRTYAYLSGTYFMIIALAMLYMFR